MTKICTSCKLEKEMTTSFHKSNQSSTGYASRCKDCKNRDSQISRKKTPERIEANRKKGRDWWKNNKPRYRHNHLMRTYGISLEQYNEMLRLQDNKCAICGTTDPGLGKEYLSVDHNHDTGEVRMLLCHSCNVVVGCSKEDITRLEATIVYLKKFNKTKMAEA